MNPTWKHRIEQIRQRWWVVVVVAVLALAVAVAPSINARPTYTAKTTLALPGLSAVDGALYIVGYMTIFNDPATIARLSATTEMPEDVTFEARTIAASPILSIEATANSPEVAQDAAEEMAEAYRADVNGIKLKGTEDHIAELRRQLAGIAPVAPDGSANPYFASLQDRIDQVQSNSASGLVQVLQSRGGVTENTPNIKSKLVLGAAGGLVLGILAALGLAALSTRPTNSADLRDTTGVEPLVEMANNRLGQAGQPRRWNRYAHLSWGQCWSTGSNDKRWGRPSAVSHRPGLSAKMDDSLSSRASASTPANKDTLSWHQ